MKIKFKVEILGTGDSLTSLSQIIANHNSENKNILGEKVDISLSDIVSFLKVCNARFPISSPSLAYMIDQNTIGISDDGGKTFFMTIEEAFIHQLEEIN